jgi:resuscitation-promoting factor RpfB
MKISTIITVSLVLLIAVSGVVLLELRNNITFEIDSQEYTTTVWAWSVEDAFAAAEIPLTEGDIVTPELNQRIPEDGNITIERAFWVLVSADGASQSLWTTERSPIKLLEMANINLGTDDLLLWNGVVVDPKKPLPQGDSHSLQVRRSATVNLDDNGNKFQITSTGTTLGAALWEQGIILHSGDQLEPGFDSPLNENQITAEVQRGQQIIIQQVSGEIQAHVLAMTVGEALAQAGVALQGLDYSFPAEEMPIPISNTIRVVRVHEEISLETEPLAFGFLTQPLEDVELDTQQVVQVGEYGLTAKRVRVVYEDGVEVDRQIEDEWVAREPKPRIVGYGTQINIRTLQVPGGTIEYWRAVNVYASTYSPCRSGGDKCYPNTSSGKPVQKGVIAVTLPWYRYMQGLPAYVPEYGLGSIEDVGGGLPDRYWIDLGYSDEDWVGWGGWTTIYFLTPVPDTIMWILE